MNSTSTIRRQAAAKADRLATPATWQNIFEREMARLTEMDRIRREKRSKGIQIRPRHWKYDGDLSSAPTRHCTLDHIARQNGDPA